MKKKEDGVVYTKTPTPPPNITTPNLDQSGLVHESLAPLSSTGNNAQGQISETSAGNVESSKMHEVLNLSQNATSCYNDTNSRPLHVARVSYQSAFEIPTENTVSDTTRGLLASKLSHGRGENVSQTQDRSYYQQRAPFIKKQNISHQINSLHDQAVHSQNSQSTTPFAISPAQSPRIVGIVAPPLAGQQTVRFRAVRPGLANDLFPNLKRMPPQFIPNAPQIRNPGLPATFKIVSDAPNAFTRGTPDNKHPKSKYILRRK
jgi:hypothetical protein